MSTRAKKTEPEAVTLPDIHNPDGTICKVYPDEVLAKLSKDQFDKLADVISVADLEAQAAKRLTDAYARVREAALMVRDAEREVIMARDPYAVEDETVVTEKNRQEIGERRRAAFSASVASAEDRRIQAARAAQRAFHDLPPDPEAAKAEAAREEKVSQAETKLANAQTADRNATAGVKAAIEGQRVARIKIASAVGVWLAQLPPVDQMSLARDAAARTQQARADLKSGKTAPPAPTVYSSPLDQAKAGQRKVRIA